MHPYLAGHLATARIADFERELAHEAYRAQLRATRSASTASRRDRLAAAVRRLLGSSMPHVEAVAEGFPTTAATTSQG